jgi:hypothetical protein
MSSPRSSRGNPAIGDIVRSIVVIGVIILGLYAFGRLFTSTPENTVKTIDYVTVAEQARPAAAFPLLAPSELPKGWRATSARFQTNGWHLGVLTDDDDYVGLEQLKGSADRAIDRFAEDSKSDGTAQIAGQTWSVRTGPEGRLTYVRDEAGYATLVNSTASRPVVEDYIESLSDPAPAG